MTFFEFILQDWDANKGNVKGRIVLLLFRLANFCAKRRLYYYLGFLYLLFYRFLVEFMLSIEIPWNVQIGKGLCLLHGQALVMNNQVIIGDYCTLRQSTTLGNKQAKNGGFSSSPIIGDHVDIGSNTCIIGDVFIGDHSFICAGTVVVKDVPPCSTVIGNPSVIKPNKYNVAL